MEEHYLGEIKKIQDERKMEKGYLESQIRDLEHVS
jgi:hypothetical protein